MNILLLNTSDEQGGADRVAMQLLDGLDAAGDTTRMLVHAKQGTHPRVRIIPADPDGRPGKDAMVKVAGGMKKIPGLWRAGNCLYTFAGGERQKLRQAGREIFDYPSSHKILELAGMPVDLVHAHNLHGHYFDLRFLQALSRRVPVLLTLHDEWMYTGHCVYSLDCDRWKTGCGSCPYLHTPHALEADGTRENWLFKERIYQESRLHIATPSQWLADRVRQSMLHPSSQRVVRNGVDLSTFYPSSNPVPRTSPVVLCVANHRNVFKDFETLRQAAERIPADTPVLFRSIGGRQAEERQLGPHRWQVLPFDPDPKHLAAHYRDADLFVLSTRADNYPLVTLEAMASGLPVIASAVGGLPEQIADACGRLVSPGDPGALALAIQQLLSDSALRQDMGRHARAWAEKNADEHAMVNTYRDVYAECIRKHREAA